MDAIPNAYAFFHPGESLRTLPDRGTLPWRTRKDGKHKRKFIATRGVYRQSVAGTVECDVLGLWAEYEGPTEYRRLAAAPPLDMPTHIHTLCPPHPHDCPGLLAHNTDPLVVGQHWLYSNCLQIGRYGRTLRFLHPGDLLVFGSRLDWTFVIDTMFVVARGIRYTQSQAREQVGFEVSPWVYPLVFDLLAPGEYILYLGATYNSPVNGLFSYAPCAPLATHPEGFARPAAPKVYQTIKNRGIKKRGDAAEVWTSMTEAVLASNLGLGLEFEVPVEFAQVRGGLPFIPLDQVQVMEGPSAE